MVNRLRQRRQRGFTLIELLIVVAIIGIIAAILIPNLIDALQKAKQKRTVADMRNTGNAWMSWLTDQVSAAGAGATVTFAMKTYTEHPQAQLFKVLRPSNTFFYTVEVPTLDGWKNNYYYGYTQNVLNAQVMAICSDGKDGKGGTAACGGKTYTPGGFLSTDYDQDIVWADGFFVAFPTGIKGAGS